jgi:hypothetical protein
MKSLLEALVNDERGASPFSSEGFITTVDTVEFDVEWVQRPSKQRVDVLRCLVSVANDSKGKGILGRPFALFEYQYGPHGTLLWFSAC